MDVVIDDGTNELCNVSTNEAGDYQCAVFPNGTYTITPEKETNPGCGLNDDDIMAVQDHILELDFFDHPWQYLAANAKPDGVISVSDIVLIRKIILGYIDDAYAAGFRSWDLIPSPTYVGYPDPVPPSQDALAFDPFIIYPNFNPPLSQDFWGIKVGDVDMTCANECHTPFAGDAEQRSQNQPVSMWMDYTRLEPGETAIISFHVDEMIDPTLYSLGLTFPDEAFVIEKVTNHLDNGSFDSKIEPGLVKLHWFKTNKEAMNHEARAPLFSIRVRALEGIADLNSAIHIAASDLFSNQWYTGFGHDPTPFLLTRQEEINEPVKWSSTQFSPNPFQSTTTLHFEQAQSGMASLNIYNVQGQVVWTTEVFMDKGVHTLPVTLPAGQSLYFYDLNTNTNHYRGRLLQIN